MATHRVGIIGAATLPDSSGNVFFESSSVKDTNDRYPHLVAIFNDTATKIGLRGRFQVPQNYVGTPAIVVAWKSTAITGDVVWDFDYTAVAVGESADPSTDQESATVTDTAAGTTLLLNEASIPLTAANLAAGDEVLFTLSRDGAVAGDTMAAAAILEAAYLEYADA